MQMHTRGRRGVFMDGKESGCMFCTSDGFRGRKGGKGKARERARDGGGRCTNTQSKKQQKARGFCQTTKTKLTGTPRFIASFSLRARRQGDAIPFVGVPSLHFTARGVCRTHTLIRLIERTLRLFSIT